MMNAEMTHFLGRESYVRVAETVNHRNGSYGRGFTLKGVGEVHVDIPKDRNGEYRHRLFFGASSTKREWLGISAFLAGVSTYFNTLTVKKQCLIQNYQMGRSIFFISMLFLTLLLPLRIFAEGKANAPASEAVNRFVFIRNGNVWIANFDGTSVKQITFSGKDASPVLSPDGKWISYHSGSDERTGFGYLYMVPFTGEQPQRLSLQGMEGGEHPYFSPDGRSIVFVGMSDVREKNTKGFNAVYATMSVAVLDPKTGVTQRIASRKNVLLDTGYVFSHPSFSPDGRLIAYQHSGSDVSGGFSVIDLSGKTVFSFPKSGSDPTPYWRPQFNPDGKQILCYSPATSEDMIDTIFMIDMKTGLKRRITVGSNPSLVDNGRSIVFERWLDKWSPEGNAKSDLWYLELRDGGQPRKIQMSTN